MKILNPTRADSTNLPGIFVHKVWRLCTTGEVAPAGAELFVRHLTSSLTFGLAAGHKAINQLCCKSNVTTRLQLLKPLLDLGRQF